MPHNNAICRWFTIMSFLVSFGLTAAAQTGTSSLRGVVVDKSRAAVSGAKVTIQNAGQGLEREAVTSASGEFEVLALPPGTYKVTIEKDGFGKYEQDSLQLL